MLATGRPATLSARAAILDHAGKRRPVEDSASPIPGAGGELSGAVLVFRDISERRQMEELLRQTQKMESLGRLAGGIAHDFNNLLTIILGSCEVMMAEMEPGNEHREWVESALDAGKRAASLTQQITAFSRTQLLEPRVLDLNDAVNDLSEMIQRLIGSNIEFNLDLEEDLCNVRIDPAQLSQVILNLAVNARDAMPRGGALRLATTTGLLPKETLTANPDLQPVPHAILSVSDTGTGIPSDVLEHIFEPFFTTKKSGMGTGLGLATAFGIIRQSGGQIDVESAPGKGTTFRVYLPMVLEEPEGSPETEFSMEGGKETILIVEDNEQVRNLTEATLVRLGYTLLMASNGREGIEVSAAYEGDIDLLLTDLMMPEVGGRQTAETIREQRPGIRVLYMSGYSDDVIIREGVEASILKLLHKPFTLVELAAKVRSVLGDKTI